MEGEGGRAEGGGEWEIIFLTCRASRNQSHFVYETGKRYSIVFY